MERSVQIALSKASLVVVGTGAEIGFRGGRDPQIGVPQPVHGQHQFDLRLVDLHTRPWVAIPEKSTTGSSANASVAARGPKPVALTTSASAGTPGC
jgi:hypothetical protein